MLPIRSASFQWLIFLLFFTAFPTIAQTDSKEITPTEREEANQVARQFSENMLASKDVGLVIPQLFSKDFIERSLKNDDLIWGNFVKKDVALKISKRDLQEYFIAETNFHYLLMLWSFSQQSSMEDTGPDEEDPIEFVKNNFPPAITKRILANPTLRMAIDVSDPSGAAINTPIRFQQTLSMYKDIDIPFRKAIADVKGGETKQWKETIDDWTIRFHYFQPNGRMCGDRCFGFPRDTRLIWVNTPILQLEMAKVNGEMKILWASLYYD